jgi:hypothetical protein
METWEQLLLKNVRSEATEDQTNPLETNTDEVSVENTEDTLEVQTQEEATVEETRPEQTNEKPSETVNEEIEDWDDAQPSTTETVTESEDKIFERKLKEAFGDDLIQEDINAFITKAKDKITKQEEDAFLGVPDDLKKAIELSKKGVDYKEYLKIDNVNYDAYSDADLYGNSIIELFKNSDGSINEDGLQEHLNSLSEIQLKLEGSKIRNFLKNQQLSQKTLLEREAEVRIKQKEQSVSEAVNSLNSVLNFKVNPYQKEKIKSKLLSADLSLFTTNGTVDYKKAAEAVFKIENFDKIVNYLKTSTANETKKQILDPLVNAEKRNNSTPAYQSDEALNPYLKAQKELLKQVRGF